MKRQKILSTWRERPIALRSYTVPTGFIILLTQIRMVTYSEDSTLKPSQVENGSQKKKKKNARTKKKYIKKKTHTHTHPVHERVHGEHAHAYTIGRVCKVLVHACGYVHGSQETLKSGLSWRLPDRALRQNRGSSCAKTIPLVGQIALNAPAAPIRRVSLS